MKRILLLVSFLCFIALMGVIANEGTNYTADTEPALIQQVFGQNFGIGEFIGIKADPFIADFSDLSIKITPYETAMPEMSLNGLIHIIKTEQMIFVNFSPGIIISPETGKPVFS